jgi:hypothetical protein
VPLNGNYTSIAAAQWRYKRQRQFEMLDVIERACKPESTRSAYQGSQYARGVSTKIRDEACGVEGSRTPLEWRPPSRAAWCWDARAWVAVKEQWQIRIAPDEAVALLEMRASC